MHKKRIFVTKFVSHYLPRLFSQILAMGVVLCLGFYLIFLIPQIKTWAIEKALRHSLPHQVVNLEGVHVTLPWNLHVESFSLTQEGEKTPWCVGEKIHLRWNPFQALFGIVEINKMGAERIQMFNLPNPIQGVAQKDSSSLDADFLFPDVIIHSLSIDSIEVHIPIRKELSFFKIGPFHLDETTIHWNHLLPLTKLQTTLPIELNWIDPFFEKVFGKSYQLSMDVETLSDQSLDIKSLEMVNEYQDHVTIKGRMNAHEIFHLESVKEVHDSSRLNKILSLPKDMVFGSTASLKGPWTDLNLKSQFNFGPLNGKLEIDLKNLLTPQWQILVKELSAQGLIKIDAKLLFDTQHIIPLGQGHIKIDDLMNVSKLFGTAYQGKVSLAYQKEKESPLVLTLNGQALKGSNLPLFLHQMEIGVTLDTHGNGKLNSIGKGDIELKKEKTPLSWSLKTKVDHFFETIHVEDLKISVFKHAMMLLNPFVIKQTNGLEISPFKLSFGKGTFALESPLIYRPDELKGSIKCQQMSLDILKIWMGEKAPSGDLFGGLKISGSPIAPIIDLEAQLKKIQMHAIQLPAIDLKVKTSGKTGEWSIQTPQNKALFVQSMGKIHDFHQLLELQSKLDGTLVFQTDLKAWNHLLKSGDRIAGEISGNLKVSGSLKSPNLQGEIQGQNGQFDLTRFRTELRRITFKAIADGHKITLKEATLEDGRRQSPGLITGSGDISVADILNPELNFEATAKNFRLAHSDFISIIANGNATLKGPGLKAFLKGDFDVGPVEVNLGDDAEDDIARISLIEGDQSHPLATKHRKTEDDLEEKDLFLPMELMVRTENLLIEGLGLKSKWSGNLRMTGHVNKAIMEGTFTSIKGRLNLLGKPFVLEKSQISFDKEPHNNSILNIKASKDLGEIHISLLLEGRANNPKITFMSNPSLAPEDIISRLLFGKELGKISTTQSLQLATALSAANKGGNVNVLDKLKGAFGLDTFELKGSDTVESSQDEKGQTLSLGKELSDKVSVSIDQAVGTGGKGKASLLYKIKPNISADVDVGGDQTGFGLSWVKNY